ncbi:MAG: translation initiation factor IF-2, partial [Deltaproteobacteria bacterium]|nr:translation initiation factor IF-2 [Deltaproteobacteria bacterium]
MPGIKVYELARDLNIPSKELIDRLNALGYEVKGNFTPLDEKTVNEVKKKLLEPVSRVESQAAPSADEDGAGDKPRKRRIISARRSGEVRKIQESLGESGPLPEDQATREEMPLDMEDGTGQDAEADQAPPQVGDVAEQPAASADSTPDAAQTSAEEGLETRETLLQPPPPVEPVDETRKPSIQAPRRVEGLPLPKPVDEDSGGVRGRNRMDEGEVRKGRRAGKAIDEVPGKGGWRDMRKEKQTERVGGDEEWVRPRRNKSGDKRRKAPKLASDEPKHTFNPRQKAIRIGGLITVADLASAIGVKVPEIIRKLMGLGIMAGINDAIEGATAELIAAEYDVQVQVDIIDLEDLAKEEKIRDAELSPRPPIITIMGHVDHGKTTLLDYIRSSRVASGEAGGITQHIGAYYVKSGAGDMVFLDTPGHEAFTSLRKRGANVTDIVILIVAADDGIMPQTREAIDHAKAAGVPILVAVNKIDRPNAQPDRIKTQLMEHGLVPEEFGGETVVVPLSAKTGKGVDELLEMIHLQAEMLELKSTNEGKARGHVIESSMDRQRGPVATVLVSRGTLEVGDHFVAGSVFGRVRAMYNDQHRKIKSAGPSTPVEILGYHELPESGDLFVVLDDEKTVRTVAQMRAQHKKEEENLQKRRVHLEDFLQQTSTVEEVRYLNIVLKADTQGSLEALQASLE